MLNLASHERIRVLLEDAQAGLRAEVNPLAAIHGAGIMHWIFQFTAAGGFIFRWLSGRSLGQISVILMI